jgi:non-specific serine/threonine protein kinase
VDAAESDIVTILGRFGRYAEAAQRGRALLARVDADGSGRNGNLPWVLGSLVAALLALGLVEEARGLVPRVLAAGRRFATPILWIQVSALAVAEQRYPAAAQLLGYTRQSYEARGMKFEPDEETDLQRILASASSALGPQQAQAWVQHGRSLDDDAAEALATGD